jgi:alkanesulfonate monooxygenase SsuD/methylene tetrahydromethanopterin reductase-like flavin-dependent oxidoreductase (luciferase family)
LAGAAPAAPLTIQPGRRSITAGTPERVGARLEEMAEATGAEEVMAVTICHDHEARVRSYELLARRFGLKTRP